MFNNAELGIQINDTEKSKMVVTSATTTAREAGVLVGYRVVEVAGTTVADLGLYNHDALR